VPEKKRREFTRRDFVKIFPLAVVSLGLGIKRAQGEIIKKLFIPPTVTGLPQKGKLEEPQTIEKSVLLDPDESFGVLIQKDNKNNNNLPWVTAPAGYSGRNIEQISQGDVEKITLYSQNNIMYFRLFFGERSRLYAADLHKNPNQQDPTVRFGESDGFFSFPHKIDTGVPPINYVFDVGFDAHPNIHPTFRYSNNAWEYALA